ESLRGVRGGGRSKRQPQARGIRRRRRIDRRRARPSGAAGIGRGPAVRSSPVTHRNGPSGAEEARREDDLESPVRITRQESSRTAPTRPNLMLWTAKGGRPSHGEGLNGFLSSRRFFANPEVACIHAHNARAGCFVCRIERTAEKA